MSNKATNNKKEKESTDRITTALHLVLGGFARVLGSAVLMGASATSPTAGKLLLELTACPSDAQIAEALDLANDAVRRDLAVRTAALDARRRRRPQRRRARQRHGAVRRARPAGQLLAH
jgi:alanyl-tRNA synthetase